MLTPFYEKLHITDTVSVIIVSIALIVICGFAATRVTKRLRLPNVTAYIVAGILIGPYCLNLVPGNVVDGMILSPMSRWPSSPSAPANSSNSTRRKKVAGRS